MTLAEWTAQISAELRAAGFEVGEAHGFPIVQCPGTMTRTVQLLELKFSMKVDRTIYAEGMLFSPAGAGEAGRRLARETRGATGGT